MSRSAWIFVALVAGLIAGLGVLYSANPTMLRAAAVIEPIGVVWVNAIRMTVVPLVISLLVAGIGSSNPRAIGGIGRQTLMLFVVFIAGAALLALLVAPPILWSLTIDPVTLAALQHQAVRPATEVPAFSEWLIALVPTNPVKAAADAAMLPVVVFTTLFALALTHIREDRRALAVQFAQSVADAMFVIVGWVLALAPIGVFALAVTLAIRGGPGLAGALGKVVLLVCALEVVGIAVLYPVAMLAGVPLRRFVSASIPAQTVGFSTRSSLAALPAMMEGAEQQLGIPASITGLVLPVAVSLFKYGSPLARIPETLFVARLYGVEFSIVAIATIGAALAVLTFYTPGVPSGGLIVMAPVYLMLGLPIEGIGMLLAVDVIVDMFLTAANVTGNMTVATWVARREGIRWRGRDLPGAELPTKPLQPSRPPEITP